MNTQRRRLVVSSAAAALLTSSRAWSQATAPSAPSAPAATAGTCPTLLSHRFPRLQDDEPQDLCQYAGKVLLVVNTASYCGFTPQYKGLEALYAKYEKQGLVVLGFPSNDFAQQEPGDAKQIGELCFNTYGVKFPMFSKTVVKGRGRNEFYKQLAQASGTGPGWNFHKYLISRDTQSVQSFESRVEPDSAELVKAIEAALRAKAG